MRLTIVVAVLGSSCADDSHDAASRALRNADKYCARRVVCSPEDFAEDYTDHDDCAAKVEADFAKESDGIARACVNAVLDMAECEAAQACGSDYSECSAQDAKVQTACGYADRE